MLKIKRKKTSILIALTSVLSLQACDSTSVTKSNPIVHKHSKSLKYNQVGYYPQSNKVMIFPSVEQVSFSVLDANGNLVLTKQSSPSEYWTYSGESVVSIEVSSIQTPGRYQLSIDGYSQVTEFLIDNAPYVNMHKEAIRAYYINRAGIELLPEFAGDYARPLGHPDDNVYIHQSAASATRPANSTISSTKGWYDAGDYNKYIVNSGISTYTLLLAYDHFESLYIDKPLNIPESNNNIADILDEIAWNLEWMSSMQDPADGSVYHKLTTLNFTPIIMPHEGDKKRYVVQKTTAAALNFSAVMAYASRLYQSIDIELSKQYLLQSIKAYTWAANNPRVYYKQPADVKTGEYGDTNVADEFAWASAELFIATGERKFLDAFNQVDLAPQVPSWSQSSALGYISLLTSKGAIGSLTQEFIDKYRSKLLELADTLVAKHNESAYSVAMQQQDFVWGSNGVAMNNALVLWQAYRLTNNTTYKLSAEALVNYVLGTNPTGYSYVTGFGTHTPLAPHHRPSAADTISFPVPGFLVGGPHSGQQDKCDYPSSLPAQSYLDAWCSYSTNEVTINWNAPLIYSLGQLGYLNR